MSPDRVPPAEGREGSTVASTLTHPDLLKFFDYWRSKRDGRLMPAKGDIDPIEIGWALSRIFLMDYAPETGFTYRLAGAEISEVFGRSNLKGLNLRDVLPPEGARIVEARWAPLVRDSAVICMKGMIYLAAERTPLGERLLLPLADDAEGPVTGLIGMTICEWVAGDVPTEMKQSPIWAIPVTSIP
ncbi:MAG: hypothetical protein Tsb0032_31360 [Kiloniellaceae bacterium]